MLGQVLNATREQGSHVMECGHTSEAHTVADVITAFAQAQGISIQAFIAGCRCVTNQTHWSPVLTAAMAQYDHTQPQFMAPASQAWN